MTGQSDPAVRLLEHQHELLAQRVQRLEDEHHRQQQARRQRLDLVPRAFAAIAFLALYGLIVWRIAERVLQG